MVGKIACPVLVLSGTTDIQVKESDYDLLKKSKKGIRAVRIENLNHVLKEVRSSVPLVQNQSYTDPKPPLHPKLAGEIVGFLKGALTENK